MDGEDGSAGWKSKRQEDIFTCPSYIRPLLQHYSFGYWVGSRIAQVLVHRSIDELESIEARTAQSMNLPRHGRRYTDKRKWRPP